MDAREQLRRYLEQRREMGEAELVLDGMTIDEAMRILAGGRSGATPGRRAERDVPADTPVPDARAATIAEPPAPRARPVEREINESQIGDWRAALRATGSAPDTMPRKPTTPPPARMETEIVPESWGGPAVE